MDRAIFIKAKFHKALLASRIASIAGDFEASSAKGAGKKAIKFPMVMGHISCNIMGYGVRYYPL